MSAFRRLPRWFTVPLMAFVITRMLVLGGLYLPRASGVILFENPIFNLKPMAEVPPALQPWARWDAAFYVSIAEEGYTFVPDSLQTNDNKVAFFPLYPVLMRVGTIFINNSLLVALLISNLCFFLALIFLYRLTEAYFNPLVAARTVLYISLFPTSFFFSAVYTEGLFLLLSVLVAWFAYQHQWHWASLCGVLASATRVQGVLLIFIVAVEWAKSHGWQLTHIRESQSWLNLFKGIRVDFRGFLSVALLPTGLVLYMLYLQLTYGNALAFNVAQRAWNRQSVGPIAAIASALATTFSGKPELSMLPYYNLLEIAGLFAGLVLCIWVWKRMGSGYALYCLICLWISASGRIQGQLRFSVILFPLFMIMALYAKPRFNAFYVLLCLFLLPLFSFFFTNWVAIG